VVLGYRIVRETLEIPGSTVTVRTLGTIETGTMQVPEAREIDVTTRTPATTGRFLEIALKTTRNQRTEGTQEVEGSIMTTETPRTRKNETLRT